MKPYIAFIGTNSVRGSQGIYTLGIQPEDLQAELLSTTPAFNTGALTLSADGRFLYAASEGMTFQGKASGGAYAFSIGEGGRLTRLNGTITHGQRPCSVDTDPAGSFLYAANFFGQSLAFLPIREDGSLAPLSRLITETAVRGFMGGLHSVRTLDGGRTVGVICMGSGELILYDAESGDRSAAFTFAESKHARHFTASQDGRLLYVLMQSPPEAAVLRRNPDGSMTLLQEISLVPEPAGWTGASTLQLTPDGSLLLAADRDTSTIAVFRVGPDGLLTLSDSVPLPGKTPRDFCISPDGRLVVTALQASDSVCVHEIDYENGTLLQRCAGLPVPSPAAVRIL